VQLTPEVRAAADRLSGLLEGEQDLGKHIEIVAGVAELLVPSLVGASVTVHVNGAPFTMTATSQEMTVLDATQYLDGGPCVDALQGDDVAVEDLLDEDTWQLYRPTALTDGIRSSLSTTLRGVDDEVIGALNLYASDSDAFKGNEEMLSEVFGTKMSDLVTNADLSFMTRDWSKELPQRVDALEVTEQAAALLAERMGWEVGEARRRLADSAGRAGAPVDRVAQAVLGLVDP